MYNELVKDRGRCEERLRRIIDPSPSFLHLLSNPSHLTFSSYSSVSSSSNSFVPNDNHPIGGNSMGSCKRIMKLIPVFLILLFFTGVLLIVYITWATFSRRTESSLFGSSGDLDANDPCDGCDIPFNLRKLTPQVAGGGGGDETWSQQGILSVDEVALYGEDLLRAAERLKFKVVSNLRRHVLNGAKVVGHINHYGVNFTQLPPRSKPNRDKIMCRIKSLKFSVLDEGTSPVLAGKQFPAEPLFSDFLFADDRGNPLMEKELQLPDDPAAASVSGEPQYRSCAVVPSSAAFDGSQHGLDIDSHDFIIRFNNAPTKGYEEDVGALTSMRIINSQVFTKPEFQFPTSSYFEGNYTQRNLSNTESTDLDALWSGTRKYLIWDPCNFSASIEQWYQKPDHPLFEKYFELIQESKKYGRDKYYILNCKVIWRLWELLYEFTFAKIYGNPPTSGFMGIILAMQKCERVNVYEFIPSSRESVRCHYYGPKNESNPACTYGSWHPVSAEKLFFLNLSDGSDKQIYMDGLLSLPGVSKFKC